MLEALNKTGGWRLVLYTLLGTWVIGDTAAGIAGIVSAARGKRAVSPAVDAITLGPISVASK